MSYCTIDDIKNAINPEIMIELVNDERRDTADIDLEDPLDVSTIRIQKCIDDATAEINSDLSRYTLPLDPVPDIIKKICVEFAIKNLYEHRDRANIPEIIITMYDKYRAMMREFQNGSKVLPGLSVPVSEGHYSINKTEDDRFFTSDKLDLI